jgi:hypothetical protein
MCSQIQITVKIMTKAKSTAIKKTDLRKRFAYKFVKYQQVLEVLELGYIHNENVILYGKGGHGKSEMALEFFRSQGIEPFVKFLGQGSQIEDLFGGLDIKRFNETGEMFYNIENSFMAHEYVILEEAFDAPLQVLEQLKDIQSSKMFRNGTQNCQIATKMIIVCTNRSREELAEDDSIRALMERFPYELKVEWNNYKATDYAQMFKRRSKLPDKAINNFAVICEEACKSEFISPRTAMKGLEVYASAGVENLKYVAGFDENVVRNLVQKQKELEEIANAREEFNTLANKVKKWPDVDTINKKDLAKIWAGSVVFNKELNTFPIREIYASDFNNLRTSVQKYSNSILNKMLAHYMDKDIVEKYFL